MHGRYRLFGRFSCELKSARRRTGPEGGETSCVLVPEPHPAGRRIARTASASLNRSGHVIAVDWDGRLSDLYDFSAEATAPIFSTIPYAAIVQLGFSGGAPAGSIFKDTFSFSLTAPDDTRLECPGLYLGVEPPAGDLL